MRFFPSDKKIFDQCCCHKITEKIIFCRKSPNCVEYYTTSVSIYVRFGLEDSRENEEVVNFTYVFL